MISSSETDLFLLVLDVIEGFFVDGMRKRKGKRSHTSRRSRRPSSPPTSDRSSDQDVVAFYAGLPPDDVELYWQPAIEHLQQDLESLMHQMLLITFGVRREDVDVQRLVESVVESHGHACHLLGIERDGSRPRSDVNSDSLSAYLLTELQQNLSALLAISVGRPVRCERKTTLLKQQAQGQGQDGRARMFCAIYVGLRLLCQRLGRLFLLIALYRWLWLDIWVQ